MRVQSFRTFPDVSPAQDVSWLAAAASQKDLWELEDPSMEIWQKYATVVLLDRSCSSKKFATVVLLVRSFSSKKFATVVLLD